MNYYQILGVSMYLDQELLRDKLRAFARANHPDVGGDAGKFAELSKAYRELSGSSRVIYDKKLKLAGYNEATCPNCRGVGHVFKQRSFTQREYAVCSTCKGGGLHG